jgi:hypothetical protein
MKRIYLSILVILGTVALTVGAAYAYFTSNAVSLTGITLASATPQLWIGSDGTHWFSSITGASEDHMYPGWEGPERTFWLENTTGGGVPFAKVIPTIVSADGNWNELKDVVEVRFGETGRSWTTGWATLAAWNANTKWSILGSNLNDETNRQISLQYRMVSGAGDSAKGKTITNLRWDFVARTP